MIFYGILQSVTRERGDFSAAATSKNSSTRDLPLAGFHGEVLPGGQRALSILFTHFHERRAQFVNIGANLFICAATRCFVFLDYP